MMGFYAYMPDITIWLRLQPDFPLKQNLLQLDAQTLQLVVFAFLLFVILAKVSLVFVHFHPHLISSAVHCFDHLVLLWVYHCLEHGSISRHRDGSCQSYASGHRRSKMIPFLSGRWHSTWIAVHFRCIHPRSMKKPFDPTNMNNTRTMLLRPTLRCFNDRATHH